MRTVVLKGKPVSSGIKKKLKNDILFLAKQNVIPKLAAIIVGNNPASKIYVNSKQKTFIKYGCKSDVHKFQENVNEKKIISLINNLNVDNQIHGILIQLPLPKNLDSEKIINSINPNKDVDGFHPKNLGLLLKGKPKFIPCTPYGCLKILDYYNIQTYSKHVVIVGRSNIVGKPLMALLSGKYKIGNSTVTICHSATHNLEKFTQEADILIVAVGKPKIINKTMIKDGVHIIDVGINRVFDNSDKGYKIVGDVDYENIFGKAKSITPVPGGVGPMTITMLLNNTIISAKKSIN